MKRLRRYSYSIVLVVFVLLAYSCNSGTAKIEYIDEPRETATLKHSAPPQFDGIETSAIGLVDTTLMVINNTGKSVLTFYSLSDLRKLADFGNLEDKYGLLARPKYSNQYFSKDGAVEFYIADTKRHNMQRYSLSSVLSDTSARPLWQTYLPSSIASSYVSIFVAPDSSLFGNQFGDGKGRGRFFRHDLKTDKVTWTPFYPKVELGIPDKDLSNYYYSQCAYNPNTNTMLSALYHFKRIDVVNVANMASKALVFRKHAKEVPPYHPEGAGSDPKRYYSFVFGGIQYFYAYCINAQLSSYLSNSGNMEAHAFTWDGKLKRIFRLDRMHLGRFVVDEKGRRLYAVNYGWDKDQHPILSYQLPPF